MVRFPAVARGVLALLTAVLVALAAPAALAQAPAGGPEIQVSAAGGSRPSVAALSGGGFAVTWNGPLGATARLLDRAGIPQGPERVVNTSPVSGPNPVIAPNAAGGFLVAWKGSTGIMGRLYDASGAPVTAEVLLGGPGADSPRACAGPSGYVVAWVTAAWPQSVAARLFDSQLAPRTGVVTVAPGTAVDIACHGDGTFRAFYLRGDGNLQLSQFDGNGSMSNTQTVDWGGYVQFVEMPRIASGPAGTFVLTWHRREYWIIAGFMFAEYRYDRETWLRRYSSSGVGLGPAVQANTYMSGWQEDASVGVLPSGHIAVAWESDPRFEGCTGPGCWPLSGPAPTSQDGSGVGIYARYFDAAGADAGGGEARVNVVTSGDQLRPVVAATTNGFLVAYESSGAVFSRRFGNSMQAAGLEVDPTDEPSSDGNRVFENGETVLVAPAWRNTTGTAETLASTVMGFGGLAGPIYSIADASADFGVLANGATRSCRDTGNCFFLGVTGARPATHWDTYVTEYASPGFLFAPRARTLHIGESFVDVPRSSPFYRFVETVFHHTVITRCATSSFCPTVAVTRDEMAFHVVRAASPALVPPNCVAGGERFLDVPASHPYCPYVEELARRGVVGGCGGGLYCPSQGVSREAMAVFLLLTREGTGYVPPACTAPAFTDVPVSSPFCRWIAELARRGIVGGCGGGAYCPGFGVTREQMSVFLTGTFGLLLYAP